MERKIKMYNKSISDDGIIQQVVTIKENSDDVSAKLVIILRNATTCKILDSDTAERKFASIESAISGLEKNGFEIIGKIEYGYCTDDEGIYKVKDGFIWIDEECDFFSSEFNTLRKANDFSKFVRLLNKREN